ncbi:pectate lyase [Pontibacter sp. BAB1700]|nr:pectate lyase [Pontibacter sp. BAB1700]
MSYFTTISFATSAYISFKIAQIIENKSHKLRLVFSLLSIVFLIIALEEISWGQRIFNLETPDNIKAINVQDELNLHNIRLFHSITMDIYILIGISGMMGWWINKKFKILNPILVPIKELRFYFLPIMMSAFYFEYGIIIMETYLNISTEKYLYFVERIDNEPCEMIMSYGFLLFTFSVYKKINTSNLSIVPSSQ